MIIDFVGSDFPTTVKKGTKLRFEKLTIPGAKHQRWYLVYTSKGTKVEQKIPVRHVREIRAGGK